MLNITSSSTMCVKLDSCADYIPIVSSMTNLVDLFLKCVFRPYVGEAQLQNNHYFAYLDTKTYLRSIILMFPVIGNILIAVNDIYCAREAAELEKRAAVYKRTFEDQHFLVRSSYNKAAIYGSVEGKYQLGCCLLSGEKLDGVALTDLTMDKKSWGKKLLRAAAALGHLQAQQVLSRL